MPLQRYLRWVSLCVLAGVVSGAAAAFFLYSLDFFTRTRQTQPALLFALPFAGLLSGWVYHRFGGPCERGTPLVLGEIREPRGRLPLLMAPLVLAGTLLTHLFGGSAGREGTGVQMGAALSDQLTRFFPVSPRERKILLVAGMSAGFGAAVGAPFAGTLFGMELVQRGRPRLFAVPECLLAVFTAYGVTRLVGAPHSQFPVPAIPAYTLENFLYALAAAICFGLCARGFVSLTYLVGAGFARWVKYPPLRPFLGGLALLVLFRWEGSRVYEGLGIEEIQHALQAPVETALPFLKLGFTALTLGSGFKGGEFVPLVFAGATLGNVLSSVTPLAYSFLAALGFASIYGAAVGTPLTCAILAAELFGARIAPFALLVCYVAFLVGKRKREPAENL